MEPYGMSQRNSAPQAEENGFLGYYEGKAHGLPPLMVGKLFLTSRYLGFHTYEVRSSGLFRKAQLAPTGKVLAIGMDKLVDVSIEQGTRSKKSRPNWRDADDFEAKSAGEKALNDGPGILGSTERFRQLMVTYESENGLEVAMFEVADPQAVADKIKSLNAKPRF